MEVILGWPWITGSSSTGKRNAASVSASNLIVLWLNVILVESISLQEPTVDSTMYKPDIVTSLIGDTDPSSQTNCAVVPVKSSIKERSLHTVTVAGRLV